MFRVKSVAKYAPFSSAGKDFFVLVVGTNFEQNQEIKNTS